MMCKVSNFLCYGHSLTYFLKPHRILLLCLEKNINHLLPKQSRVNILDLFLSFLGLTLHILFLKNLGIRYRNAFWLPVLYSHPHPTLLVYLNPTHHHLGLVFTNTFPCSW